MFFFLDLEVGVCWLWELHKGPIPNPNPNLIPNPTQTWAQSQGKGQCMQQYQGWCGPCLAPLFYLCIGIWVVWTHVLSSSVGQFHLEKTQFHTICSAECKNHYTLGLDWFGLVNWAFLLMEKHVERLAQGGDPFPISVWFIKPAWFHSDHEHSPSLSLSLSIEVLEDFYKYCVEDKQQRQWQRIEKVYTFR